MRITMLNTAQFEPNKNMDFATSLQNVKLNGVTFDFRFTPDSIYLGDENGTVAYRNGVLVTNTTLTADEKAVARANASKSKFRVLMNLVNQE